MLSVMYQDGHLTPVFVLNIATNDWVINESNMEEISCQALWELPIYQHHSPLAAGRLYNADPCKED